MGSYHLEGVKINCSYYECDSVDIIWNVVIAKNPNSKNKNDIMVKITNSSGENRGAIKSNDYIIEEDVTTFTANGYEQLTINHITKKMVYEDYYNFTAYNITSEFLRKDTLSEYTILEGYKD